MSDRRLRQNVADALSLEPSIEDTMVTLGGKVTWNLSRVAAEHAIRKLAGVKGVLNLIDLKQHASATEIKNNLKSSLQRDGSDAYERVDVAVLEGGLVRLKGEVQRRRSASRRARRLGNRQRHGHRG